MVLILSPNLEKDAQEKLFAKIKKDLEAAGGKIEKEEDWGRKELAYRIKKANEGLFFLWSLTVGPEKVFSFEQKLKLEEGLLRYLLVKKEEKKVKETKKKREGVKKNRVRKSEK